jgi:hypothetical protein
MLYVTGVLFLEDVMMLGAMVRTGPRLRSVGWQKYGSAERHRKNKAQLSHTQLHYKQ